MSHSFGEGYASRCDEEGFGGTYGGNRSTDDVDNDDKKSVIHENHPGKYISIYLINDVEIFLWFV